MGGRIAIGLAAVVPPPDHAAARRVYDHATNRHFPDRRRRPRLRDRLPHPVLVNGHVSREFYHDAAAGRQVVTGSSPTTPPPFLQTPAPTRSAALAETAASWGTRGCRRGRASSGRRTRRGGRHI